MVLADLFHDPLFRALIMHLAFASLVKGDLGRIANYAELPHQAGVLGTIYSAERDSLRCEIFSGVIIFSAHAVAFLVPVSKEHNGDVFVFAQDLVDVPGVDFDHIIRVEGMNLVFGSH